MMNVKGLLLGACLGILAAALLIGGVSVAGAGAQHIDLLSGNAGTKQGTGVSSQAVGPTTAPGEGGSQAITLSNTPATTSGSGESILALSSPLVLAAALGGIFYGLYARRVNAE